MLSGKLVYAFGAAILGAMAAAIVPISVWEGLTSSLGLGELLSAAAPPLGGTARFLLVTLCALIAAAAVLAIWPEKPISFQRHGQALRPASPTLAEPMKIQSEKSTMQNDTKTGILDRLRGLRMGKSGLTGKSASAEPVYRRADLHPDAPLRSPIMASRDFQSVTDEFGEAVQAPPIGAKTLPGTATPFDPAHTEAAKVSRGLDVMADEPVAPKKLSAFPDLPKRPEATVELSEPRTSKRPATHDAAEDDAFSGLTLDELVERLGSAIDQQTDKAPAKSDLSDRSARLNAKADEMDDALKAALATLQEMNVRRA